MQLIDVAGHALMRYYTRDVVAEHIEESNNPLLQRKVLDDYIIQKNYYRSKKENNMKNTF